MKKFAVIGYPIKHSKSPQIHNAGFQEFNIEAEFEAIEVKPENLEKWMQEEFPNYEGLAVTIPHKETIGNFLDKKSEASKIIGAVNTVYRIEENICGTNTDCIGALKALQTEVPNLKDKKVLVLGAGGASRALLFALKTAESKISLWNRTEKKAIELAEEFQIASVENLKALNPDDFDIIINSTSVGLGEWKSLLDEDFWQPHHVAFDMVYKPLETKFLNDAENAGGKSITGDKMLVFQALEQFKIWHDIEVEPEIFESAFFLD